MHHLPQLFRSLVLICAAFLSSSLLVGQTVSTLAGSGIAGTTDGTGVNAQFDTPNGLSVDAAGNIYVADVGSHIIRKVTPAGVVTTLAGSGIQGHLDGASASAQFDLPIGTAVDSQGKVIVSELSDWIREIDGGMVSTISGNGSTGSANGLAANATYGGPSYMAVDSQGNLLIVDRYNHKIRKLDTQGNVTTLAGSGSQGSQDGNSLSASFNRPYGICVNSGDTVYVVDRDNEKIRMITPSGQVSTIAGTGSAGFMDGPGSMAQFNVPTDCSCDNQGNIYVTDRINNRIRKIDSNHHVTTFAGTGGWGAADGPVLSATFNLPTSLVFSPGYDYLYIADTGGDKIREIAMTLPDTTYCDTLIVTVTDTVNTTDTLVVTVTDTVNTTDTLVVTVTDTVNLIDTVTLTVHDTLVVYDTVTVVDTLWMRDTVWIHDTVYIQGMQEHDPIDVLQVYPNPFYETLNIQYTLKRGARVRIRLFDASGRLVESIQDQKVAPGPHQLRHTLSQPAIAQQAYVLEVIIDDKSYTLHLVGLP